MDTLCQIGLFVEMGHSWEFESHSTVNKSEQSHSYLVSNYSMGGSCVGGRGGGCVMLLGELATGAYA